MGDVLSTLSDIRRVANEGAYYVGEVLALIVFLALLWSILTWALGKPQSKKATDAILALFLVVFCAPTILGTWAGLWSFMGYAPFRNWSLVSAPLNWAQVTRQWPDGIYHCVARVRDVHGANRNVLLPNNLSEPMNIGGLTLGQMKKLVSEQDPQRRLELAGFVCRFLQDKIAYRERSGSYSVSRRLFGELAHPTANNHVDPDVEIESLLGIAVYRVPWCADQNDYRFRPETIEWCSDVPKLLVAEYAAGDEIVETTWKGP